MPPFSAFQETQPNRIAIDVVELGDRPTVLHTQDIQVRELPIQRAIHFEQKWSTGQWNWQNLAKIGHTSLQPV